MSCRRAIWPVSLLLLLATQPLSHLRAQGKPQEDFIKTVGANFLLWDQNHDQTLSVEELDSAIEDAGYKGQAAAALAALKRAARMTNFTLPPLTMANISHLASSPPATNRPNLPRMYSQCLKRITGETNHELFVSGLPQLSTIHQGRMGDCFCLAPLGAMIHRDPYEVAALFTRHRDGSISVQFGGGAVTVQPPTDAELALTAGNTHDGVWVNLYEKAISKVRNDEASPDKRSDLSIDAIATGGSGSKIMSYLTGHKVTGLSLKFGHAPETAASVRATKLAELRQKLAAAVRHKNLIICSTKQPTTPGLTSKHAYAVLDYVGG